MEAEVHVRCRKSDYPLVKTVIDAASNDYKSLMKREVKYFNEREVPLNLILDDDRFIPEYDIKEGPDSCMGGVLLHAKKGRILCSNTLDSRLQLVYQEATPEIRANLFTSFVKDTPAQRQKDAIAAGLVVESKKPHHWLDNLS